uniref:Uncharacterized protein n=1 Tax=Oncorhynchus mykiss TaxID=8022 RepID=A0A8C7QYN3_ONCMY
LRPEEELSSLGSRPRLSSLGIRHSRGTVASPFIHLLSSDSSLCTVSFIILFFSFSFSYFFFHCSAVSSRFTDAVFLIPFMFEPIVPPDLVTVTIIQ